MLAENALREEGMTRVAEGRPEPKTMAVMEELKQFGFRLIFLSKFGGMQAAVPLGLQGS